MPKSFPEINGRTFISNEAVLGAVSDGSLSMADALAALEALKPEAKAAGKLSLKTSRKGAISVYGMGRFPVTLYLSQWERAFAELPAMIAAHAKADKPQDHEAKGEVGKAGYEPAIKGVVIKRGNA